MSLCLVASKRLRWGCTVCGGGGRHGLGDTIWEGRLVLGLAPRNTLQPGDSRVSTYMSTHVPR